MPSRGHSDYRYAIRPDLRRVANVHDDGMSDALARLIGNPPKVGFLTKWELQIEREPYFWRVPRVKSRPTV